MNAHISKVTLLNKQDFLKILMKSDMNLIWIYMQILGLVYVFPNIFRPEHTHVRTQELGFQCSGRNPSLNSTSFVCQTYRIEIDPSSTKKIKEIGTYILRLTDLDTAPIPIETHPINPHN